MKNIIYSIILLVAFAACDDGITDGGVQDPKVNMTTLEFLQLNAKFDTVLILFDRAGILNELGKPKTTACVPTDYSINRFVIQIQTQKRKENNDENLKYTFTDLMNDFEQYKDSMKMYIIKDETIGRGELESKPYLTKCLLGTDMQLSLKESPLYNEWLPNIGVKLLHYKWVKNGLDPENVETPLPDRDIENICQTSGIITTNGALHVLEDTHNLFFNRKPLPQ